jgi:hypothetical protein
MKALELMERPAEPFEVAMSLDESEYTLKIAGVYQNNVTRDWATQTSGLATRLAGEIRVQNNWYDLNGMSDPCLLLEAVRAALLADVIVISVFAADELPINLDAWIAAWLPRRLSQAGVLAALVGAAELIDSQSVRTLEYLQGVARKARLDYIPQERKRPVATSVLIRSIVEGSATNDRTLPELYGLRHDGYYHWGLNE